MAHTPDAHSDKHISGTPASTACPPTNPSLLPLACRPAVVLSPSRSQRHGGLPASRLIPPRSHHRRIHSITEQRTAGGGTPLSVRRVDESQERDERIHESGSQPRARLSRCSTSPAAHSVSAARRPLLNILPCCCCRSNRRTVEQLHHRPCCTVRNPGSYSRLCARLQATNRNQPPLDAPGLLFLLLRVRPGPGPATTEAARFAFRGAQRITPCASGSAGSGGWLSVACVEHDCLAAAHRPEPTRDLQKFPSWDTRIAPADQPGLGSVAILDALLPAPLQSSDCAA